MPGFEYKICVLIVTYGDRWQFLKQVLTRVTDFKQVINIVVVDNASIYNVNEKAGELNNNRITVITNKENTGSAGGYKTAIEYGINKTGADLFFLLDDDNLPADDVADVLLKQWKKIAGANNKKVLFCLREDRVQHLRIARGENPYRYYLVPDNFLGFNVFRIFHNQYSKLRNRFATQAYLSNVKMPYVPYGGLMLHRSIIDDIGYPDERFFLYVDDSEYTYRITQNGGTIWLIPACKVVDIDKSQGIIYQSKLFHSKLLDLWSFRSYYHIRNRMFFYSRWFIKDKFIFRLNKMLYLGYLKLISLLSGKSAEYKKLLVAVNDGLHGQLGRANTDKF